MKISLSFIAQSLDNTAPNPMMKEGRILHPKLDAVDRIELANSVDLVANRVTPIVASYDPEVLLFITKSEFVIQLDLPDRDVAGRIAPILCYGDLPHKISSEWIADVIDATGKFISGIGRQFDIPTQQALKLALNNNIRERREVVGEKLKKYVKPFRPFHPNQLIKLFSIGFNAQASQEKNKEMISDLTPVDPNQHKAIILLSDANRTRLWLDQQSRSLFNNNEIALVVDHNSDIYANDPIIANLRLRGLLRQNSILIQNPYDVYMYIDIIEASETLAKLKYLQFGNFCQLLGATTVSVVQVQKSDGQTRLSWQIDKNDIISLSGSGAYNSEQVVKLIHSININLKLEGNQAKIKEAQQFIEKNGLDKDEQIVGLLNMRENKSNQLKNYSVEISTTREIKQTSNVVGKLNFPVSDLQAQIDKFKSAYTEYSLITNVTF